MIQLVHATEPFYIHDIEMNLISSCGHIFNRFGYAIATPKCHLGF